jgi:hypothetical protein
VAADGLPARLSLIRELVDEAMSGREQRQYESGGAPRRHSTALQRRMSAVDQAYRYAINLPCDEIIVTSMRRKRAAYPLTWLRGSQ